MKIVYQKSRSAIVLGTLLSFVALVGFALAKGGHGGGHHGGGHHGGHHGSHHSGHHSSHHSHHGDHHHHTHVHHHYHGGHHGGWGWGGYGGWGWGGWGGGLWGVPFGYPDSAPYSVPYDSGDISVENNSDLDPEDDSEDGGDDDGNDDGSDEGDADNNDEQSEGETATGAATAPDRGALHIKLPTAKATVLFDGEKMIGFGKERWVLTPKVAKGESTKFQVQATWTENGSEVKQVREGKVSAGQKVDVDFTKPEETVKSASVMTDGLKSLVMPFLHSRIANPMAY